MLVFLEHCDNLNFLRRQTDSVVELVCAAEFCR